MGLMRFLVTPPDRLTDDMAQQALLSGIDRGCWQIRASLEAGELRLQRGTSESANLQLPWPVDGRGLVTLSTGSLVERDEPYHLPLELARGVVCQLRNQLADWQAIGLNVPETAHERVAKATWHFGRAAINQDDRAATAEHAEAAIRTALEGGDLLAAAYVEAAAYTGRRSGTRMNGVLGVDLGMTMLEPTAATAVAAAFSAANVPLRWSQIENSEGEPDWTLTDQQFTWCAAAGLKVCAGPLVLFDPAGIPDWLCLWDSDFDSIGNFITAYVQRVVQRYRGKVHAWQCAGRVNTGNVLGLTEEERLRLTAHTIELVHALDPKTPVLVSFDQPWGEYLARRPMDVPPLHYVDALVRAELNIGGLMWELNVGCQPGGTSTRTIFEFSRHLDLWSGFGLPLWITVSTPSGTGADPRAARPISLSPESWSAKGQAVWIARHVPLMLAKPYVQGVFWNPLRDAEPHDFPHTGLFDTHDHAKPALKTLATIRQAYLNRPVAP